MSIKQMQFVLRVENVINIHRNICTFSKSKQVLAYARIVVENLVTLAIFVAHFVIFNRGFNIDIFYFSLSGLNSFMCLLFSCYHSKQFSDLQLRFQYIHEAFKHDSIYIKNLQKWYSHLVGVTIAYVLFAIGMFVYYRLIEEIDEPEFLGRLLYNMLIIQLFFYDIRYIFEFFVLCAILTIISEQLGCLIRLVKIGSHLDLIEGRIEGLNSQDNLQEFSKWSAVYVKVKECSNCFNTIFGVQLTIMLATVIIYYIKYLYTLTSLGVRGAISTMDIVFYTIILAVFLMCLLRLSYTAQAVCNNVATLRRTLCRLILNSISNEECYKASRDMLRLVCTRPIRAVAFGSIAVDMTLCPACVMFFTSYTVIVLQFNNVV